jgi:2'-5' RNA ligase
MPRLFVALELPDGVKDRLGELCHGVPGARWVPRDQMHLTLRFIGDVDGGTASDVREALTEVRAPAFLMALHGVGHFPPRGEPHVLWVGVRPSEPLRQVHAAVERAVRRAGIPAEDRKFHAHVTLARLKGTPARRVGEYIAGNGLFDVAPFPVTEVALFSSQLSSLGAAHALEATQPLETKGVDLGAAPD